MFATLLLALTVSSSPFSFVGQPACVDLEFTGQSTRLTNRCEAPVLVDQSVQVGGLIPAGSVTEIRDLSAFTLGLGDQLYQVVAVVEPTPGEK